MTQKQTFPFLHHNCAAILFLSPALLSANYYYTIQFQEIRETQNELNHFSSISGSTKRNHLEWWRQSTARGGNVRGLCVHCWREWICNQTALFQRPHTYLPSYQSINLIKLMRWGRIVKQKKLKDWFSAQFLRCVLCVVECVALTGGRVVAPSSLYWPLFAWRGAESNFVYIWVKPELNKSSNQAFVNINLVNFAI